MTWPSKIPFTLREIVGFLIGAVLCAFVFIIAHISGSKAKSDAQSAKPGIASIFSDPDAIDYCAIQEYLAIERERAQRLDEAATSYQSAVFASKITGNDLGIARARDHYKKSLELLNKAIDSTPIRQQNLGSTSELGKRRLQQLRLDAVYKKTKVSAIENHVAGLMDGTIKLDGWGITLSKLVQDIEDHTSFSDK